MFEWRRPHSPLFFLCGMIVLNLESLLLKFCEAASDGWRVPYTNIWPGGVDTAGSIFLSGTTNLDSFLKFSDSGCHSTWQCLHQNDVLFCPASVNLIKV